MKKMNNKGFSLVELIIVIAIMAILAGALAPALIKYIAKSRRSSDANNAGSIQSAIQTAMSDEDASSAGDAPTPATGNTLAATDWKIVATQATTGSFWKQVNTDLSGGLAAFNKAKTTKLKNGAKATAGSFIFAIDKEEGVHVGVSFSSPTGQFELVPTLHPSFDGK